MESFEPADSVAPTDVVDSWLREGRGFRRAFLKMAWGSLLSWLGLNLFRSDAILLRRNFTCFEFNCKYKCHKSIY